MNLKYRYFEMWLGEEGLAVQQHTEQFGSGGGEDVCLPRSSLGQSVTPEHPPPVREAVWT